MGRECLEVGRVNVHPPGALILGRDEGGQGLEIRPGLGVELLEHTVGLLGQRIGKITRGQPPVGGAELEPSVAKRIVAGGEI